MKYIGFIILTFMALCSCKNEPDELFEISYDIDSTVFEAGLNQFQVHYLDSYEVNTRIDEYLAANGRTRDDISSIVPKSAEITNLLTNTSLDFLQRINLHVFDGSQFTPDVTENVTEIFFRDNVPQDRRTFIDLLPALPNVKDQMLKDKFNISLRVQLRVPPPNTVEARMKIRFSVQ